MARKHHQSVKSRMKESRGEERHLYRKEMMSKDHYSGMEPRRRQEMQDAGMLHEDHRAVANLPQDVKYHDWPGDRRGYLDGYLNDDISGINRQMAQDEGQAKRFLEPHKW